MRPLIIIFLVVAFQAKVHSQEREIIIDPVVYECYRLKNVDIIKPLRLDGDYYGKMLLQAEVDTIHSVLMNFRILFARLQSVSDINDSIEIRYIYKSGNYMFLENNIERLIEQIPTIEVDRVAVDSCVVPEFVIPITIVNDE